MPPQLPPTVIQHINRLTQQLTNIYPAREAKNMAIWVLEYITGNTKLQLYAQPQITLSKEKETQLLHITTRLMQHEPLQYVLEQAPFFDMLLTVNPQVLIPRPETEELVQLAVQYLKQTQLKQPRVIDIGTGSGCIAVAVKRMLPHATVYALDVSPEALSVALVNARKYQCEVEFICADILDEQSTLFLPQNLDLLISNPPYITFPEKATMAKNVVNFEPHLALFVPQSDPLLFYRAISGFAQKAVKSGGAVFYEVHEQYAHSVQLLLQEMNFTDCIMYPDSSGRQRMVSATCFPVLKY